MIERIRINATVRRVPGRPIARLSLLEEVLLEQVGHEKAKAAGMRFHPDLVYLLDADRCVAGRPNDRVIYRRRGSSKWPEPLASATNGQKVTLTATATPWDNGLGAYLNRITDVTVVEPEEVSS